MYENNFEFKGIPSENYLEKIKEYLYDEGFLEISENPIDDTGNMFDCMYEHNIPILFDDENDYDEFDFSYYIDDTYKD